MHDTEREKRYKRSRQKCWKHGYCVCRDFLQQDGKAEENAAEDSGEAETGIRHEDGAGTLVVIVVAAAAAASGLGATKASHWNGVGGSTRRGSGGGHGSRQRSVAPVGFLSTARVVLTAGTLARSIAVAVIGAVGSPLLADEEGQGLGVLGDVGRDAVITDAFIGQVVRVAVI